MSQNSAQLLRVIDAIKTSFIADALAMPVHWFYQPIDIESAFPGGIQRFEKAPEFHPSAIMSLHSKRKGGRQSADTSPVDNIDVVGDIILKDKAQFWDSPNVHYHQGMQAGENTLNAHCARLLMRSLAHNNGYYDRQEFINNYIDFMTVQPATHPDTYAESYHRGFFANLAAGKEPEKCAMKTHDTGSIGGLVTIAPLVFTLKLKGVNENEIQTTCRAHLALTHPDEELMSVCDSYVTLLCGIMEGPDKAGTQKLLLVAAKKSPGVDILELIKKDVPDYYVIGNLFSRACYISDSWPVVLYLAYKYLDEPLQALLINTNLGGDNVHRGSVLGSLLGLKTNKIANIWFDKLADSNIIAQEIDSLMKI